MRFIIILALIIVLVIGAFFISNSQQNNSIIENSDLKWNDDYDTALKEAKQNNKPVLIDFYAEWCGACKLLDQDTFSNPEVIEKLGSDYVLLKVDVDRNPELASQYQIYSLPTIVITNSQGQTIRRQEGYIPPDQFLNFI